MLWMGSEDQMNPEEPQYVTGPEMRDFIKRTEEKEIAKASQNSKPPERRCCFGIYDKHGTGRCTRQSVFADTFHGFTTGLSWCEHHSHKDWLSNWPHAQIRIS